MAAQAAQRLGFPFVTVPADCANAEAVLRYLVGWLVQQGRIPAAHTGDLTHALVAARTRARSVLLPQDIAVPHARHALVRVPAGLTAPCATPAPWPDAGDPPVRVVCLVLVPEDRPGDYLRLLDRVVQDLRNNVVV